MGCGQSSVAQDEKPKSKQPKAEAKSNTPSTPQVVDSIPIRSSEFETADYKILLLGAGECGKSTIWRQLKLLYCGGFSDDERAVMAPVVKLNVISDIKSLMSEVTRSGQSFSGELQNYFEDINSLQSTDQDLVPEAANEIKALWQDPIMKASYKESNSIGLGDYTDFFFDNVERIAQPDYLPTDEDLLKSRIRTTGISIMQFEIDNKIKTDLYDIGGQKCERAKWSKCFTGVNYLLFVVSLSDFDQYMFEDDTIKRTQDSIDLFTSTATSAIFKNKPIFLILNKKDMFEKKLKEHPDKFRETYPGFEGDITNVDACIEHVKNRFLKGLGDRDEKVAWVKAIPTCAMDANNIRSLFQTLASQVKQDFQQSAEANA